MDEESQTQGSEQCRERGKNQESFLVVESMPVAMSQDDISTRGQCGTAEGKKGDGGRQRKVCQELDLKKKMQRQRRNLKHGQIQCKTGSLSSFSMFSVY